MASTHSADIEIQKIDVKIALDSPAPVDPDVLLHIFGRWRLEEGEEIVDLADYSHVPMGPNILLVSHRWQFGIDDRGGRRGCLFSCRKGLEGDLGQRLRRVLAGAASKVERLLAEDEIPAGVSAKTGELEIAFNDRLALPNDETSDAAACPVVEGLAQELFGAGGFTVERVADPGARLEYRVVASGEQQPSLQQLSEL